jgi:mono/diheme cytochrome c family protein
MRGLLVLGCVLFTSLAASAAKMEAPKPTSPSHAGVGRQAPDISTKSFQLSKATAKAKGTVIAITSTTCPLSKKFLPNLVALEAEYAAKGFAFVLLSPMGTDTEEGLKKFAEDAKFKGTVIHDVDGSWAKALGAKSTTDVYVLDAKRTIVYRGALDDQYGLGYSTDAPKHTYAKDAMDAVLADKRPKLTATTAPGCELDLDKAKAHETKITYHNTISRLVQQHCLECHRNGGVGPFELSTREQLLANKGMIKKVVNDGTMPPWHAAEPKAGEPRPFKNDRSLPETDKKALLAWLADGAPEGDATDAPLPRIFSDDWAIGKPDLVVQIPKPIKIKASGFMDYEEIIVDTGTDEEKWVVAAEVQPTDRRVVHHVLVFSLPPLKQGEFELPRRGEGQGYFAAYVPGNSSQILPEGFGRRLQKGARLKFQLHYTPNGTATKDQTKVGFRFAKEKPANEIRVLPLGNPKIEIPPGADNHPETAEYKLPVNAVVTAFSPHMHVRGKDCKYEIEAKDGTKTVLLDVPHYDFNWQLRYELAEPLKIERGSVARFHAHFNNSNSNPANPDPKATVRWGQQTYEEMLLGYIEFYIPK